MVTVTPVNDAPSITIGTDAVIFTEDEDPQKVAASLTMSDIDSSQMSGADVWLEPEVDKDSLYLPPGALDDLPISSQKISDFRLRLYTVASIADYQAALRQIEFKTLNQNPVLLTRNVRFRVEDSPKAGTQSSTASALAYRDIVIVPVNDPPSMTSILQNGEESLAVKAVEDGGSIGDLLLQAIDVEYNPVRFAISCQARKGDIRLLNDTTGAFDYTPAPNAYGMDAFFALAIDSNGSQSIPTYFEIDIEPRPDLPVAGNLTGEDEITVYVGEPIFKDFPISHPDGLDQILGIYVKPVKGILTLTNSSVGDDGIQRGVNPFKYSANKGSGAAVSGKDEFEYTVVDKKGAIVRGIVSIRVFDWDDLLNTPPVAYGTSGFEANCTADDERDTTTNGTNSNSAGGVAASASLTNNTEASNASRCVNPYRMFEGSSISVMLEASDAQTQRRNLNFTIAQPPEHGSFVLVNEEPIAGLGLPKIGTLTYTPKPLWHGYDLLRFRASDGRLSSNETTVHFVVDPINNPPVLACAETAEINGSATVVGSGGADLEFVVEKHRQLSEHPLCQFPLSTASRLSSAPMSLGQVGSVYDAARRQLSPAFQMQMPSSLSTSNGMFAKISSLANSVLAATAGMVPIVIVAGSSTTIRVPMGGGHNQSALDDGNRSYALQNMSESTNATEPSEEEPAVWGTGGSPMFLAVALVSFDPDDEGVPASSYPDAPKLTLPIHGIVDPVLTELPTNGARVFAVNANGTVGKELTFNTIIISVPSSQVDTSLSQSATTPNVNFTGNANYSLMNGSLANGTQLSNITGGNPEATATLSSSVTANVTAAVVPGAVLFIRFADGRRGSTTLRWRARDGGGLVSAQEGVITAKAVCRSGYRRVPWWWDSGQCVACPSGHYNLPNTVDQDSCAACPPGSFSPQPGSTACYWCDSSTFNDSPGRRACQKCLDVNGASMLTRMSGRTSRRECECPVGSWVTERDVSEMNVPAVAPSNGAHGNASDYWAYPESKWTTASSEASSADDAAMNAELAAHPELATVLPKELQGPLPDGALCTMHDPIKCGAALTTASVQLSLAEQATILGNGLCNAAANVRACGWDCGDCCKESCLNQNARAATNVLDATNACPPSADSFDACVDPRFTPPPPGSPRLDSGVAPVCVSCDNATTVCETLNQTFPLPRQGFWINPVDPSNVLQCAEPSAAEACLAHTNVSDVRAGVCGVSKSKQIYQGRACAFCGDGTEGTLRSFRAHGKCKVCPDVLWLPYVFGVLVIFLAGPALRGASQMQDGFGAINIAVAFSQIIAIFRQLDLQWPDELLELFNMISFFNLNVDLLSIDCFVSEWSFNRKFFLANLIPVLFGLTFLIRVLLTMFHNTYFLPKVYLPAANQFSRIFGTGTTTHVVVSQSRTMTSSQAAVLSPGSDVVDRGGRTNVQHPTLHEAPEEAASNLMSLESFDLNRVGKDRDSRRAVTEGVDDKSDATPGKADGGVWNRARLSVNPGVAEEPLSWAVPSPRTPMTPSRRIVQLVEHVSSPITRRVSRAASALLSEVEEEDATAFARRMQCAFLLFLSWAYMALASINVEYYNCQQTGEDRIVLVIDPTVECWTGMHLAMWPLAMAGTALYVCGIPLMFTLIMFSHRRLLAVRDLIEPNHPAHKDKIAAEQRFGFMFRRYEAEYHWWELMFFFRKLGLITTQAFFKTPLDSCLLTMIVLMPGVFGILRSKPYDSPHLDVMEWIASSASFLILFSGFLFFSDLLTPGDSKIVLWCTIGLLIVTYVIIGAFIAYDLFPHGIRAVSKMKFRLDAAISGGASAVERERERDLRIKEIKAKEKMLKQLRSYAGLVFNKSLARRVSESTRTLDIFPKDGPGANSSKPPPTSPGSLQSTQPGESSVDGTPASLWEMVQMFKCISANVKTLDANGGKGDDKEYEEALRIYLNMQEGNNKDENNTDTEPLSSTSTEGEGSSRPVYRKPRSKGADYFIARKFTKIPSLNRSNSSGAEYSLVGTPLSELRLLMKYYYTSVANMVQKAKDAEVDKEFQQEMARAIIAERIRNGTLKPPALGEGVFKDEHMAFLLETLAFRSNRPLFLQMLMLLEYLRLKQAADAEPFWGTAMGRRMLLEHSTLLPVADLLAKELENSGGGGGGGGGGLAAPRRRDPTSATAGSGEIQEDEDDEPPGGLAGDGAAAVLNQMQKAADYYRALQESLKRREGEGELDILDDEKGGNPLMQMGSQISSYSTVFHSG